MSDERMKRRKWEEEERGYATVTDQCWTRWLQVEEGGNKREKERMPQQEIARNDVPHFDLK